MISTLARYQMLTTNPTRTRNLIENDATYKRETVYYQANIGKIKTIDEFVNNYRIFNYAMKAHGLQDMAYGKAFIKKMLEEGVTNPKSMASKMTDPRYKEFAKAFDFAEKGALVTSTALATTETVSRYMVQTLELNEGQQNEGVQLALYFKRKASSVTSAYGLLGDKALLKFVQTAFNIPTAASRADIDAQARNLSKLLKVEDLKNPTKVEKLIQRFTAMWDMNNVDASRAAPVLSLFGQAPEAGFSVDLMMSIARLRQGGG